MVIRNIGTDHRCDVHSCLMGVRENKDGWLHLFAPGGPAVNDWGETEGHLFSHIVSCSSPFISTILFHRKDKITGLAIFDQMKDANKAAQLN
jgi:hypothetical protein